MRTESDSNRTPQDSISGGNRVPRGLYRRPQGKRRYWPDEEPEDYRGVSVESGECDWCGQRHETLMCESLDLEDIFHDLLS